MAAWRTKFDGVKIETPVELRGAAPGEVVVIYPSDEGSSVSDAKSQSSIWDAFGKAPVKRSAVEIHEQVRGERDAWGER